MKQLARRLLLITVVPTTLISQIANSRAECQSAAQCAQEAVESATTAKALLESFTSSMKDAVVAFDSDECPKGWHPYPAAYGRFLRGIDPDEKEPSKVRTHGSQQNEAVAPHTHNYNDYTRGLNPCARGTPTPDGGICDIWVHVADASRTTAQNVMVNPKTDNETRPKNVAVLFCVQD